MKQKDTIVILLLKRNLRVRDHEALCQAISSWLPVVALYCYEPSVVRHGDFSSFHLSVINDSLIDLQTSLKKLEIDLLVFHREMIGAIEYISQTYIIDSLFSQEETGNGITFSRDKKIAKYCRKKMIWRKEYRNNGIIRGLKNRDERWSLHREAIRSEALRIPTRQEPFILDEDLLQQSQILDAESLSVFSPSKSLSLPSGGETAWRQRLASFLKEHSSRYLFDIGKPYNSTRSCSRLSHFLAFGNLSIRYVLYVTNEYRAKIREQRKSFKKWDAEDKRLWSQLKCLTWFVSRLHRHCHFIQKLESDPAIEYQNLHPLYDSIRCSKNEKIHKAFISAQTWIPLIDAAIRCLHQTWRINFRLRATLVSFYCNTCMQDRRHIAHFLARLFVDYEPGIHYSQLQMQAGTTGINQYRIYNPTKQQMEKDPEAKFIDKWIPELSGIERSCKAEPWKLQWGLFWQDLWCYSSPIVNIDEANRHARERLRALKNEEWFRYIADDIYIKHGSRKK